MTWQPNRVTQHGWTSPNMNFGAKTGQHTACVLDAGGIANKVERRKRKEKYYETCK